MIRFVSAFTATVILLVMLPASGFAYGEWKNSPPEDHKRHIWAIQQQDALRATMKDGDSTKFKDLSFHENEVAVAVCGLVNSKNSFGAYGGWQRWIGAGAVGQFLPSMFTSTAEFNNVWNRVCR